MKTASGAIGICRYPSGIQPWNGNDGILMRNASAKTRKIHFCEPSETRFSRSSLSTNVVLPDSWPDEHAGRDRADEHQQRADERVDEELEDRGAALLGVGPPHQREEVERHEHQVEEDDEEREVLREERAHDAALREAHQQRVEPGALGRLVAQRRPQRGGRERDRRRQQQDRR